MQNTTNTQTTTENTQHTLADYLEARDAELQRAKEQQAQQERERTVSYRREKIETLSACIEKGITGGLRRALDLSPIRWIESDHPDVERRWYHEYPAAPFTLDGEEWSLTYEGGDLTLCGPNGYNDRVKSEYIAEKGYLYNRSILDLIREYPAWLESKRQDEERTAAYVAEEDASMQRAAEQRAAERAKAPRHYSYISGSNEDTCLLHLGASVTIEYAPYYMRDADAERGTVESWDKQWILITRDDGRQRIINRQHIAAIEPYTTKPANEKPEPAAPGNPDMADEMMSDSIPF